MATAPGPGPLTGLAKLPPALLGEVSVLSVLATLAAWLDCRELELDMDPAAFFLERVDVLLSSGPDFGSTGFVRLNFATSGPLVEKMLDRMRVAVAAA